MIEPTLTRQDFWKSHTPLPIRRRIQAGGVCGYLSAATTLAAALLYNPLLLVDALLMVGLALGTHLKKSRKCSTILFAYFLFSKIAQFMQGGGFGGTAAVVLLIAFGSAAHATYQFQSLWKSYQQGKDVPNITSEGFWDNP